MILENGDNMTNAILQNILQQQQQCMVGLNELGKMLQAVMKQNQSTVGLCTIIQCMQTALLEDMDEDSKEFVMTKFEELCEKYGLNPSTKVVGGK